MKRIFSKEKYEEWHMKTYHKMPPLRNWAERCYGKPLGECVNLVGSFLPASIETWFDTVDVDERKRNGKHISVVITFDGLTTKAELIDSKTAETCKSAEAHCNPSDVYSRSEGARIAIERLFEKKKK